MAVYFTFYLFYRTTPKQNLKTLAYAAILIRRCATRERATRGGDSPCELLDNHTPARVASSK